MVKTMPMSMAINMVRMVATSLWMMMRRIRMIFMMMIIQNITIKGWNTYMLKYEYRRNNSSCRFSKPSF